MTEFCDLAAITGFDTDRIVATYHTKRGHDPTSSSRTRKNKNGINKNKKAQPNIRRQSCHRVIGHVTIPNKMDVQIRTVHDSENKGLQSVDGDDPDRRHSSGQLANRRSGWCG